MCAFLGQVWHRVLASSYLQFICPKLAGNFNLWFENVAERAGVKKMSVYLMAYHLTVQHWQTQFYEAQSYGCWLEVRIYGGFHAMRSPPTSDSQWRGCIVWVFYALSL
jgi:hypothetical protein